MKFTIQTILSIPTDGASCHLLIFNKTIKILLDCGISHTFDFNKYLDRIQDIKSVCLVLVSHSQIQYSGALPFLVDEIGINPKIIYTTQSIMRYSPLNLHEELLNLCCKAYGKKTFNKIYKIYQSINIIKPQQKKCLDLSSEPQTNQTNPTAMQSQQLVKPTIGQVSNQLYFTCFSSGSSMGNLAWRLSFGIVNILYLVQFNNYGLYHINGINLQQIMAPTDVLITDTYKNINDSQIKKSSLYQKVKDILIRFYERNGMMFEKPPLAINPQTQKKLVFSCYPNQMIIQLMAVVKKVLQDLQPPQNRQKIRVVHLSSRFLQLIKSQMDYFSNYFRDSLQNIQQNFLHSKQISGRINITTFQSIQGLLSNSVNTKPIQVYHFGPQTNSQKISSIQGKGQENIMKFKLLNIQQKLVHSASKIEIQQQDQQMEDQKIDQAMSQKQQTVSQAPDQVEIIRDVQPQTHQPLHSRYFNQVGFPRFTSKFREKQFIFDDYGCRHQYARFQDKKTGQDDKKQMDTSGRSGLQLQKKNSTIQIMNIQFKIPQLTNLDFSKITFIPFFSHRTNFNSSIQIIATLKPDNVILINTQYSSRQTSQSLSYKYKSALKSFQSNSQTKQITMYDINPKKYVHLQLQNQLISYKVNYIPIPQQRKLQKVKGLITYSANGLLYIHLDCLEQKQHLQFRLDKFYKKVKEIEIHQCFFTNDGLIIDGVKIYRENNRIVLEGVYSQQYFKVRRLLYDFLKMQ